MKSIVTRWTTPTKTEKGRIMIKPKSEWSYEERRADSRNFTTILAIQCGMEDKTFELIAASRHAKKSIGHPSRNI